MSNFSELVKIIKGGLVDVVIDEIIHDVEQNDFTAISELLNQVDNEILINFLPEEKQQEHINNFQISYIDLRNFLRKFGKFEYNYDDETMKDNHICIKWENTIYYLSTEISFKNPTDEIINEYFTKYCNF